MTHLAPLFSGESLGNVEQLDQGGSTDPQLTTLAHNQEGNNIKFDIKNILGFCF